MEVEGGSAEAGAVAAATEGQASESEAKRRLLLLLALCTKKPSLLTDVLRVYARGVPSCQVTLQKQVAGVIPHISAAVRVATLVKLAQEHPPGSELLLLKMLHTAAELDDAPPRELAVHVARLCDRGVLDARFLVPALPSLRRSEVTPRLPMVCGLPANVARAALLRLLGVGAPRRPPPTPPPKGSDGALPPPLPPPLLPPFTPAELLVALHEVRTDGEQNLPSFAAAPAAAPAEADAAPGPADTDAQLDSPPAQVCVPVRLGALIDATNACLKERSLFPPEVLVVALGSLLEQTPIPRLALRTLLQALIYHPKLSEFALDSLQTLAQRSPWAQPNGGELWEGFARCAKKLLPRSLGVLLRAPPSKLEQLLSELPELRAQLLKFITEHKPTGLDPAVAALLEGAAT
mmetsp:Transcript_19772/g.46370  ORF Transcript_19772/g.46370 Transcript_19772/m.46370 type:complete len:406 (+) Transcript_19772:476-1693(+)